MIARNGNARNAQKSQKVHAHYTIAFIASFIQKKKWFNFHGKKALRLCNTRNSKEFYVIASRRRKARVYIGILYHLKPWLNLFSINSIGMLYFFNEGNLAQKFALCEKFRIKTGMNTRDLPNF